MRQATLILAIVFAVSYVVEYDTLAAPVEPGVPGVFRFPLRKAKRASSRHVRRRRDTAVAESNIDLRGEYPLITISIGTPPQPVILDIDTGSSDLWFSSSLCSNCQVSPHRFDPKQSSTYRDLHETSSIVYFDETGCDMEKSSDTVTVGDGQTTITVRNQVIGLATFINDTDQSKRQYDGVIGMGWLADTALGGTPIVLTMYNQSLIAQPMYSIYFTDDLSYEEAADDYSYSSDSSGSGLPPSAGVGELIFGGVDKSKYSGDMMYVPLSKTGIENGKWQFSMTGIKIGDKYLPGAFNGCFTKYGCEAIPDSGSSELIGPDDLVIAIYKALGASLQDPTDVFDGSSWAWPCPHGKISADLQPISFLIGDNTLTLQPSQYTVPTTDTSRDAKCYGIFQCQGWNTTEDYNRWDLGDALMTHYYIVYDYAQKHIGFATI